MSNQFTDTGVGGRKALAVKRKEICNFIESGTVEHNGIILKKVHTAIINHKKTTYFKCKNMRTPTHVSGVCIFSARIIDFPESLFLEILNEHSSTCCYVSGNQDLICKANESTSKRKRIKKSFPIIKKPNYKVNRNLDILDINVPGVDLSNIYVDLWTKNDIKKIDQHVNSFNLLNIIN